MNANASLSVYANSHGFLGAERATSYSTGCALIAGEGEAMQRDGWYSVALAQGDLESPEAIGRRAARRTLDRLDPRRLPTGQPRISFDDVVVAYAEAESWAAEPRWLVNATEDVDHDQVFADVQAALRGY